MVCRISLVLFEVPKKFFNRVSMVGIVKKSRKQRLLLDCTFFSSFVLKSQPTNTSMQGKSEYKQVLQHMENLHDNNLGMNTVN